jgi:hypothetical protein
LAARIVGGFFAVMGAVFAIFGRNVVSEYTPIRMSWIGWAVVALGIAVIAFPRAAWVQRAVARFEGPVLKPARAERELLGHPKMSRPSAVERGESRFPEGNSVRDFDEQERSTNRR